MLSRTNNRAFWVGAQLNNKSLRNTNSTNFNKQRPNFLTFFGENGRSHQVTLYEQLANDGGTIRFSSPFLELRMTAEDYNKLPIMIFIPGFDGSGLSAIHQFPYLVDSFDFMTCTIPLSDRTPFVELVNEVKEFIKQYVTEQGQDRPVYLLADSFGALLALMTASQCPDLVDRLVLINPATSYKQSIWPILGPLISQVPNELFLGVSFAMAPFLGNPLSLIARTVDFRQPLDQQINEIIKGIFAMFGTLGFLGDIFTPESLAWKIELVRQGVEFVNPLLSKIKQRTLVITCDGDWMLPSSQERSRLINTMPRCSGRSMGLRSHALLLEAGVNIAEIIKEEGFYVKERKFSIPGTQHAINAFGTVKPVELPTKIEQKRVRERFMNLDRFVSPVFYSTNIFNEVVYGLNGLPNTRPILFIGNHQLSGQDTGTLIKTLLEQKNILLRGLAHPLVASLNDKDTNEDSANTPVRPNRMRNFITTYGAVSVSPKNLHELMKQGERVLLYPGGAREALKLKRDEKYQLFWPETAEFVRTAAKFQATIITVAAVGFEDWLEITLDREDILQLPILKDIAQRMINNSPEARPGISNQNGDVLLMPIVRPKVPKRLYFLFGKPFTTTIEQYMDKEKGQELYEEIKNQLETNITYLQQKSGEDPYGDFVKRMIYETSNPGKQAPSFEP
eukprot:g8965.t1